MTKRCSRCCLPENLPGLTLDDEGVCNFCRKFEDFEPYGEKAFLGIIREAKKSTGKYDAVVPLSGGRDSTYVLYMAVKKYGLKVLAVSYDNGFRDPGAARNIYKTCEKLNVDLVDQASGYDAKIVKYGVKSTMHMGLYAVTGMLCKACLYGYKSLVFREAISRRIPLILWGNSKIESTSKIEHEAISQIRKSKYLKLLSPSFYVHEFYKFLQRIKQYVKGNNIFTKHVPHLKDPEITELSFFDYLPWDRREIKNVIMEELNWKIPKGHTSSWRTDCLIHPFLNYTYMNSLNCTKSCLGYSNMINAGKMTREEAIKKEEMNTREFTPEIEEFLFQTIKLSKADIEKLRKLKDS